MWNERHHDSHDIDSVVMIPMELNSTITIDRFRDMLLAVSALCLKDPGINTTPLTLDEPGACVRSKIDTEVIRDGEQGDDALNQT